MLQQVSGADIDKETPEEILTGFGLTVQTKELQGAGGMLAEIKTALETVVFPAADLKIQELKGRYQGVVFPVTTGKGMEEAKAGRNELTDLRVNLEKWRIQTKSPFLRFEESLDEGVKRIIAEIAALEKPIVQQIRAEDERRAAVKAEQARLERERKAALCAKVEDIRNTSVSVIGKSAAQIKAAIDAATALDISEENFGEYVGDAMLARDNAVFKLEQAHAAQLEVEAEQARLKAEREELERLRVEAEARAKAEREAQEALLRAERERMETEMRVQREEAARIEAENKRLAEVEQARVAAERAELARQKQEAEALAKTEREAHEAVLRAEREKQEAELRVQREEAARQEAERARLVEAEEARMKAEREAFENSKREFELQQQQALQAAAPVEQQVEVQTVTEQVTEVEAVTAITPVQNLVDERFEEAKRDLMQFRDKYHDVAGLGDVLAAIDSLIPAA
jgi:hypothetical protein